MPMLDARQPVRQLLALGNALRWSGGLGFELMLGELALGGRNIGFKLRLPQRQLLRIELLRRCAKAPAAQLKQLELQRLDFEGFMPEDFDEGECKSLQIGIAVRKAGALHVHALFIAKFFPMARIESSFMRHADDAVAHSAHDANRAHR